MNRSTFFEIKYMNVFFSKANMTGVGFKILARTYLGPSIIH